VFFSFFDLGKQVEGFAICVLGDVDWPIQGLMRYFCPKVERRITKFRAADGTVGFGGHLASAADDVLALLDNVGLRLPGVASPADATCLMTHWRIRKRPVSLCERSR